MASIITEVRDELINTHSQFYGKAKKLCETHADFIKICWDKEVDAKFIAKGIMERLKGHDLSGHRDSRTKRTNNSNSIRRKPPESGQTV